MDILCVDQSSVDARISAVQHIPTIFRRAKKTIVIRDGGGLRPCCTTAIGKIRKSENHRKVGQRLVSHFIDMHDLDNSFDEGVLE